jgi:geranylgeranyl diphosphate synthase type I
LALNCGNWLYFWAQHLIEHSGLSPAIQWQLFTTTSRALLACHYGQALDLTLNVQKLEQDRVQASVEAVTELKTGALMELAAIVGAQAAGTSPERVKSLGRFGRALGVVLQMLDDLSGLVSERRCHKGHEDLLGGRPTWPWAWLAAELPPAAFESLQQLSADVQVRDVHPELLARELRRRLSGSGRMRIRRTVRAAFAVLRDEVGHAPGLDAIQGEISRLEKSYA